MARKKIQKKPLPPSTSANPERDAEIYEKWQYQKISSGLLGEEYGMSHQRIHQIVRREAKRRGEEPRKYGVRVRKPNPAKKEIDAKIAKAYLAGKITAKEGAKKCGLSPDTFVSRIRQEYGGKQEIISREAAERNAKVYEEHQQGKSVRAIAEEYGKSELTVRNWIFNHRTKQKENGRA